MKERGERGERGRGHLYRRGEIWWCRYYRNGKGFAESTKEMDEEKARKFLNRRLAEVLTNIFAGPRVERIRVSELADAVIRDYRINGKRSLDDAEARWKNHLEPVFGHLRAVFVSSDTIAKYIDDRLGKGASNATVNRELAFLKRAFHLGQRSTPPKVLRCPYFPRLAEDNVRTGFVDDAQYAKLSREARRIGLWLSGLFECGYAYGWRVSELLGLTVGQVDFLANTIRLNPGETKNRDGRTVTMTMGIKVILTALAVGKAPSDKLFTRNDGTAVVDFRESWEKMTKAASCPDLLFHDLRRTAVRNMVRNGIPERVAMTISGHKTRSIFDRYNVVSERDLADAAAKMDAHLVTLRLQSEEKSDEQKPQPPAN